MQTRMKAASGSALFLAAALVLVAGEAPPLPYAAASSPIAASSFVPAFSVHGEESQQGTGSYTRHYGHGAEGFDIQSGFEGYLVPSPNGNQQAAIFPLRDGLEYLSSGTGAARLVKQLAAKGLRAIPKIAVVTLGAVGLLLLGCLATTAVCTFTPFCSISFLGWGVARESVRSFLTEDAISATAAFVSDAIRKYRDLYEHDKEKLKMHSDGSHD